jgi:hypothetical protein
MAAVETDILPTAILLSQSLTPFPFEFTVHNSHLTLCKIIDAVKIMLLNRKLSRSTSKALRQKDKFSAEWKNFYKGHKFLFFPWS